MNVVTSALGPCLEELTRQLDLRARELFLRGAVAYGRDHQRFTSRVHLMVASEWMDHGMWRSLDRFDITDESLVEMSGLLPYTADHLLYLAMHMPVVSASSVPSQRIGDWA